MGWIIWGLAAVPVRVVGETGALVFDGERNLALFLYPLSIVGTFCAWLGVAPSVSLPSAAFALACSATSVLRIHTGELRATRRDGAFLVPDCLFPLISMLVPGGLFNPELVFSMSLSAVACWVCSANPIDGDEYLPLEQGDATLPTAWWIPWVVLFVKTGENLAFAYLIRREVRPFIDLLFFRYAGSSVSAVLYNLLMDGSLSGAFNWFGGDYSFRNYTLFLHKFLLEFLYTYFVSMGISVSPNPGYPLLLSTAYYPVLHIVRVPYLESYRKELLCVAFYLQAISIFFLVFLGRHVDVRYNTTNLTLLP
jgi:hypothetical protein